MGIWIGFSTVDCFGGSWWLDGFDHPRRGYSEGLRDQKEILSNSSSDLMVGLVDFYALRGHLKISYHLNARF